MSYRDRTSEYWKTVSIQFLTAVIVGGLGLWIINDANIGIGSLSVLSLISGALIGSTIAAMSYIERLEDAYDRVSTTLLMLLGSGVILFFISVQFLAGFALSFGATIVATVVTGELIYQLAN